MSVFSDVEALYGSLKGTWSKTRTHVISHAVLGLVLFGACGVGYPEVQLPQVSAQEIANDDWYKLAKDSGVIYVSFALPVVALALYGTILRSAGQLFAAAIMLVFPPKARGNLFEQTGLWALQPLALLVGTEDFQLPDLYRKALDLRFKYEASQPDAWQSSLSYLGERHRNAMVYLGDFMVFWAVWIGIFWLAPSSPWVAENQVHFWPGLFGLLGLVLWWWFRASRLLDALPANELQSVALLALKDPDLAGMLAASDERRTKVLLKLDELLREQERSQVHAPSLREYIEGRLAPHGIALHVGKMPEGAPFPSLYERGRRFLYDDQRNKAYGRRWWLDEYRAYLYYLLHRRCADLIRTVFRLWRQVLTGGQ
jgi:hypothetical protein